MWKNILFDLDGTLTDPKEGIINSFVYAVKKLGLEMPQKFDENSIIGPPLFESLKKIEGINDNTALMGIKYYREYFEEKGMYENKLYDGIVELLSFLTSDGKRLYIATSKPRVYAEKIVQYFAIDKYFTFVSGPELSNTMSKKSEIINIILDKFKLDKSETIMIGDRKHDIEGARESGITSVGVLYGYGTSEELVKSGADFIAGDLIKLKEILI